MIDMSLREALISRRFDGEFILPSYDDFCLSNVPATIQSFFGLRTGSPTLPESYIAKNVAVEDVQNIVLMVFDGLGYCAWLRAISEQGFFQTVTERGFVLPITTVFPSTTAAALTTLATGLTPQEHGLPEWYVYLKELDGIIASLRFSPMGTRGRDLLVGRVDPKILFSGETIYTSLSRAGVNSVSLLPSGVWNSAYSSLSLKGSRVAPYQSLSEYATMLRKQLSKLEKRAYVYAYYDAIDSMAHSYGPNTDEWQAEVSMVSHVLKHEFLEKLDLETARKTLLIVTADHGHINVNPQDTLYLNRYRKVVRAFKKSDRGKTILPSWSPRDMVLYIKENDVDGVQSRLLEILQDRAAVLKTKDAVNMGLFGRATPSKRFIERAGDLLLLPHRKDTIWFHHERKMRFEFLGMHGGLTEDELLIPLAVSKLSNLTSNTTLS